MQRQDTNTLKGAIAGVTGDNTFQTGDGRELSSGRHPNAAATGKADVAVAVPKLLDAPHVKIREP